MRKPSSYESLADAMVQLAETYRQDIWRDQDVYVEVWVEKDAMAGVLLEETSPWDIPLMVSRGFSSESYLYEAAEQIKRQSKPTYIYYFGDHDPSGVHIDRDIEKRLRRFAPEAEIHFVRLAVTPEQIEEYQLPTRPPKSRQGHGKNWKGQCVEVDAIPPHIVRQLLRDAIEGHVDRRRLEVTRAAEKSEQEVAFQLAKALHKDRDSGEGRPKKPKR
jgi:hypothetical protein